MRALTLLLCAGILAACARPIAFTRADMSAFPRDDYECRREATYSSVSGVGGMVGTDRVLDRRLYAACMGARGYTKQ